MAFNMLFNGNKTDASQPQELLFRNPYIWLITISITTLNFLITYNLRNANVNYIYFYLVDILTTYLIIDFYAIGIAVLNRKAPLNGDFTKRITYQFTVHTLAVVLFSVLINELLDNIFFSGKRLSLSFEFYTQDTVLSLIFALLFHCLYIGLYLLAGNKAPNREDKRNIKVFQGMANKMVPLNEIVCFYTALGNTYVITNDNDRYHTDLTLTDLEQIVSEEFFRVNRQFLIRETIIDSYQSIENGKIEVQLKSKGNAEFDKSIIVSRGKASTFRAWLKGS